MKGEVDIYDRPHVLITEAHNGKGCKMIPVYSSSFGRFLKFLTYISGNIDAGWSILARVREWVLVKESSCTHREIVSTVLGIDYGEAASIKRTI